MNQTQITTRASIFPPTPVDPRFAVAVRTAEAALGVRVFCIVHHHRGNADNVNTISPWLFSQMLNRLNSMPRGTPIAVLLHSPGGDANSAFRIARMLNRHCGEYSVLVPRWAKSAATLLSLGASTIYLGEHAELGPIDVQLDSADHERQMSALEVVQSLERLNSEAMQAADAMMTLLLTRTGKRIDSLLPSVLKYATDVMRPIVEKVDTVSFTYYARLLKIGEDYATSLLRDRYGDDAEALALALARGYPDHGFVIDRDEADRIGLEVEPIPDNLREPLGPSLPSYSTSTVLGFLEDVSNGQAAAAPATGAAPPVPPVTPSPGGSGSGKLPRRNGAQRRTRARISENGSP